MVQKEKQVKSYTRKSKSGKQVQVKAYSAKYESAEDMVKEALKQKKGAGKELEDLKKKKPVAKKEEEKSPYDEYGFTKDEFKEWYEGTGSKADKKVEKALKKAMGTKAYNALSDKAADEYKKGGAHRFFTKGLEEMKASTSTKETKTPKGSIGISQSDWDDAYGVGGAGSDGAMKRIDSAARKYLGAKAYNKWAKYQDDSDDTGGSYKGFLKQLEKFKEGKGDEYAKQSAKKSSEHLRRSLAAQHREYTSKMSYAELKNRYSMAIHPAMDNKAAARKYAKSLLPLVERRVKEGKGSKWDEEFLSKMGKSFKHTDGGTKKETSAKKGSKVAVAKSFSMRDYRKEISAMTPTQLKKERAELISRNGGTINRGNNTGRKIAEIMKLEQMRKVEKKSGVSKESKVSKISDASLKAKGYVPFKDYGTTLYIGKRGKAVYMKTSKGIVKADRDDYADFVTGHNGLSKANRKKLESLGWHEHEEY